MQRNLARGLSFSILGGRKLILPRQPFEVYRHPKVRTIFIKPTYSQANDFEFSATNTMHAGKLRSVKHAGILDSGEVQTKPQCLMRSKQWCTLFFLLSEIGCSFISFSWSISIKDIRRAAPEWFQNASCISQEPLNFATGKFRSERPF